MIEEGVIKMEEPMSSKNISFYKTVILKGKEHLQDAVFKKESLCPANILDLCCINLNWSSEVNKQIYYS